MRRRIRVPWITCVVALLAWASPGISQNILSVADVTGGARDTVAVGLSVRNAQAFVAFQVDIELPDAVEFIPGWVRLTSRADGHVVSARLIETGVLRILAYSLDQKRFLGSEGPVAEFRLLLGTHPGTYALRIREAFLSDSQSADILSEAADGSVTILAPDILVSPLSLNFGRLPLGQSTTRSFTISNTGNRDLTIGRIFTDSPFFEVQGDTSGTLPHGGSMAVTIRFRSVIKGDYAKRVYIHSDDPNEPVATVRLGAVAFAVNEIHVLAASGRSGYPITLSFRINNMEPFVGFQFDLLLPGVLTYREGSERLSDRAVDHEVGAAMVAERRLRVLSYSPTNRPFKGDDGIVCQMDFLLRGLGGSYSVGLDSVFITDSLGVNIVSAFYGGQVNIAAPDIGGPTSVDFGRVSVTDTGRYVYELRNSGNDTLVVWSVRPSSGFFRVAASLLLYVEPGSSRLLPLLFLGGLKGRHTGKIMFRSNDPDEDPWNVQVAGELYTPNEIVVQDTAAAVGDTVDILVDVQNYEDIVAFQFDLAFPDSVVPMVDSCSLTDRADGHVLTAGRLGGNTFRFLAYSLDMKPFRGKTGPILRIPCLIRRGAASSPLTPLNALLANAAGENVLSSVKQGRLTIYPRPVRTQFLTFDRGWNWFSLNLEALSGMGLNQVFASCEGKARFIKDQTKFAQYYDGYGWYSSNGLDELDVRTFYMLRMDEPAQVSVKGVIVDCENTVLHLVTGWNWIGYLPQEPQPLGTALRTIEGAGQFIKNQRAFAIYYEGYGWYSSNGLDSLRPGDGYMLKMGSPAELVYCGGQSGLHSRGLARAEDEIRMGPWAVDPARWELSMAVTGVVVQNGQELRDTAIVVGAFCGDECRGLARLRYFPPGDRYVFGMLVYGEEGDSIVFRVYDENRAIEMSTSARLRFQVNGIVGNGFQPFVVDIVTTGLIERRKLPLATGLWRNYPNPFNSSTLIRYSVKRPVRVNITIYDMTGAVVRSLVDAFKVPGTYSVRWDARDSEGAVVPSGVYVCRMQAGNYDKSIRLLYLR